MSIKRPLPPLIESKTLHYGELGVDPEERQALEQAFDPEFYLVGNPDVLASGMDPLDHYLQYGWKEGRDPTPFFSTTFYLATYSDVSASGVNPFWHFVTAGKAEGRASKLDVLGRASQSRLSVLPCRESRSGEGNG